MIQIYLKDRNNVLLNLRDKFEIAENPRDADCFVLWQDVRGDMRELCKINEEHLKKPVIVVQHGRAATNDYLPPNNFPMQATKFCCWGIRDYVRLIRAGHKDKAVITGSPLVDFLQPKLPHDGKNIVFCPVITMHEEPDNLITYWTLKRIELTRSIRKLEKFKEPLRNEWHAWTVEPTSATEGSIPYYNINKDWRLIAKITDIHDKRLYFGDVVSTLPVNKTHLMDSIKILQMTDCVVGLEEGTFQLLAMAMGIPCIMVDGFRYKQYGGIDYSSVEQVRTDASRWVNLSELESVIDEEMAHPGKLKRKRKQVVKDELWDGKTNPTENIINIIREVCRNA